MTTLNPTADTRIEDINPTTNYGTQTSIQVGEWNGGSAIDRTLIKFDLSGVSSAIVGATLRLYDDGTDLTDNTRTMFVNRSKRAWTETGATWNKYDGTNNWATAGGGTNSADVELSAIGSISMPNPPSAGYVSITLTASAVEEMRNGTFTNNGFLLSMGTETNDMHQFNSREGTNKPELILEFSSQSSSSSASASKSLSPSASQSPSSSNSSSISSSASLSESASQSISASASLSPSSSLSPSASESQSQSSSESKSQSPSASESKSESSSVSLSASPSSSVSKSQSPSSSPSMGYSLYSRGAYALLPSNDNDLATLYTEPEEVKVSESDDIRVDQTGSLEHMIHQFKVFVGSNNSCEVNWEGQSSLAPTASTVYLQVYNQTTGTWETVASNSTSAVSTDFTLTKEFIDLTDYKLANLSSFRVYQLAI